MARGSTPSIRFAIAPASWPTSISPIYPGSDLALALGLMHVIIGENLHDADYVANYTDGFEAMAERAARVSAGARGSAHGHCRAKTSFRWRANTRPRGRPPSGSTMESSAASAVERRRGRLRRCRR